VFKDFEPESPDSSEASEPEGSRSGKATEGSPT
jgi:hypothetical protein